MNYIGENLLPGQAGHFFIILSLVSSLAATVFYFLSVQNKNPEQQQQWKKLGRIFFLVEVLSVFLVFGILFYIISNHLFEYKYAWQHSSRSLEAKYLLSCFWEGQEGSFLLWSVWHCVIGCFFIWKEKEWEAPVMTVVSFVQFLLATMIVGIPELNMGSNPFMLLRNSGMLDNAPAYLDMTGAVRQDYLSFITDGNDLNPLLQNYWMVIHPPVLFLGFSAAIIPFAFAVGGLWTKRYTEWTKPALPWALFAAAALGLGIMMGAAWAYESLNFGGYWAWDPVENASLVPWLILIAGIHTLVIYRHTGNALRTTFFFFFLSFLFVLYSTYLTRSGDLEDTSVHAFTGEGITKWHLRFLLLLFALPVFALFIKRYKEIPYIAKEEETSSREFWMFIGSLVIFLSALLITLMTSIPIFNKLATLFTSKELFTPIAVGEDAAYSYNQIQIFIAIILGTFTGFGMYLKYKATGKAFLKKLIIPGIIGVVAAVLMIVFGEIHYRDKTPGFMAAIWLAVVAAVFSLVANASYLWTGLKGNLKRAGGTISHIGFALMLIGILISSSKKEILSYNTSGIFMDFGKESKEKPGENLTLVHGVRTDMGKYWVTYEGDSTHPKKPLWFYNLKFESKDGKEDFILQPNAFVNYKGNMGLMANPDARHKITHDIFTYITSLPDPEKNNVDTTSFKDATIKVGDTVFYSKGFIIIEDIASFKEIPNVPLDVNDSASVATIKVLAKTGSIYTSKPILINKGGTSFFQPDTLTAESLILQLQSVNGKEAELGIKESDSLLKYVTLKAYKFPFINVLWLGTIIMIIGIMISMFHRRNVNKLKASKL